MIAAGCGCAMDHGAAVAGEQDPVMGFGGDGVRRGFRCVVNSAARLSP